MTAHPYLRAERDQILLGHLRSYTYQITLAVLSAITFETETPPVGNLAVFSFHLLIMQQKVNIRYRLSYRYGANATSAECFGMR